ncbi:helix-turn-helix transcriptional regulator [Ferrovibrio sp. MS7]|uniref:response regulator transcription factor n=1 Tax=Ferrovibrio plantarum TaxID=3119164 RepID=UPI003135DDA6
MQAAATLAATATMMDAVQARPNINPLAARLHIREIQIVRLIGHGLGNREIAERLALSVQTVKWYNKSLFQKLNVANRAEALSVAKAGGLL